MYSVEFRKEVMDYYYNVSHSQSKTANKFGIGKTTISQWKQEDEGKIFRKRTEYSSMHDDEILNVSNYQIIEMRNEDDEKDVELTINGYEIRTKAVELKYLLRGMK